MPHLVARRSAGQRRVARLGGGFLVVRVPNVTGHEIGRSAAWAAGLREDGARRIRNAIQAGFADLLRSTHVRTRPKREKPESTVRALSRGRT
jgi:hypothetical protein